MSAPVAPRGLVFDLFHTLTAVGSEAESPVPLACEVLGIERGAWEAALGRRDRGHIVGEERDPAAIVGTLARAAGAVVDEDRLREASRLRTELFRHILRNIPDENLATLKELRQRGYRLGLLSNADAMEVAAWQASPLRGLFDVELFSCDAGCMKPEAEFFHACVRALALAPAECWFIGDGGFDELQGARAAGLRTVFMSGIVVDRLSPEKVAARRAVADFQIQRIPELLALLSQSAPEETLQ